MVQVRGYSEDDVDVLADEFELVIAESLSRAVKRTAADLTGAVTAASSAGLSPDDVARVSTYWQEEVDGVLVPYVGEVYKGSATSVAVGLADGFPSDELAGVPLVADEFQLTFMKSVTSDFVGVGDDVWEDVRTVLVQGVKNGESIEQIAAKITQVPNFTKQSATRVARTAVHSAAESGSIAQLRYVGYEDDEVEKEWLFTHDKRTRLTHIGVKSVPLNAKFVVGGSRLDFPGDPLGAYEEIVNCRCTALFNIGKHNPPKFRCDGIVAASGPPSSATACVLPTPAVDISMITAAVRTAIFNAFMKHKISPAYGGAKIHKVLQDVKAELAPTYPDAVGPKAEWEILAVVDDLKTGPGGKFTPKYTEWAQSPAGKKAGAKMPSGGHVVTPVLGPADLTGTPTPVPNVTVPGVWQAPSGTFKILADPGSSGDGYAAGGQWGKYGAAGALIRAKDADGVYRYLLIQRNGDFDSYEAWKWQLPGGALDELEGPYEGAAREIVEELGVDPTLVEGLTPIGETTYVGPGAWHYTTIAADASKTFDVDISGGPPRFDAHGVRIPPELSDAKWFTAEEIQQMLADGKIVKHLDTQITSQINSIGLPFKGTPSYVAAFEAPESVGSITGVSTSAKQFVFNEFLKIPMADFSGPQTYSMLVALRNNINATSGIGGDVSEAQALSLLQLLRVVDEQSGGADTLELNLLKWLQTSAAKKTVYKQGFPKSLQVTKTELPDLTPTSVPTPTPTPPPPLVTTTVAPRVAVPVDGSIAGFDYFMKQDVLTAWVALGGGKKVTPAWGGAKIWKLLQDLKADSSSYWVGGAGAPNELQLLRILDDAGGFTGKPKTYESEFFKWLNSPAGKKALPNPPASLVNPPTRGGPVATPVVAPAAAVAAVDEAATTIAATGNKKLVNHIFVDLPKYKDGDAIAYVQTINGDTLKAVRFGVSDVVAVYVRKDSLADSTWTYDKSFDDWTDLYVEYNITSSTQWSFTTPTNVVITHIPGKAPGDVVTFDEIWASRYLWKDGDVVAEKPTHRVIAKGGNGDLTIQDKSPISGAWNDLFELPHNHIPSSYVVSAIDNGSYKLTSIAPSTKTSTIVTTKNVGDEIASADAWASFSSIPNDKAFAYGFDPVSGKQYRLRKNSYGVLMMDVRSSPTGTWSIHTDIGSLADFNTLPGDVGPSSSYFKWYVANNDGTQPDVIKARIPGVGVPGMATPSKIPGAAVGDEIPLLSVTQNIDKFNDYEVIGSGKHLTLGTEYRLYNVDGGLALEIKSPTTGAWHFYTTIDKATPHGTLSSHGLLDSSVFKWYATDKKVTPTSVGAKHAKQAVALNNAAAVKKAAKKAAAAAKKAAKKSAKTATKATTLPPIGTPVTPPGPTLLHGTATHVPGKSVGDEATKAEIWSNRHKYVNGQVIAYVPKTYAYGKEYRIFMMDGHMLQQHKSASGSWVGTKKIYYENGIPGGYSSVPIKLTNDMLSNPNMKSAKKFVDTKLGGPAGTPVGGAPSTTAPAAAATFTPAPSAPFAMTHVDITPWNDVERQEIYDYFKSKNIYVSSDPGTVWAGVQGVKSHFQTTKGGKWLNLNEVEILRIVDERGAIKFGVTDTHPFESKITNWLQTPAGKAFVNRKIDAPIAATDVPVPMSAISGPNDPPLDRQSYTTPGNSTARAVRADDHAKYGGWTASQRSALKKYTGGIYSSWNDAIRKGSLGSYRSDILTAQQAMRPSTKPMLLHRKVGWPEFNDASIHSYETLLPYVGRTYVNRGFNSTATTSGVWHGSVHIEIECPIGTPMAHVQDFSNFPGENETILPAHLIYQIMSVSRNGAGGATVRVRVIGVATP